MPAADDEAIRARLATMTIAVLENVVTIERGDYVPRALALAEDARRSKVPAAEGGDSPALTDPSGATQPTPW
jgi:hypothetical protein